MKRFRVSPALIVSIVALVVALSGVAVGLPGKNSVDKGDIKKNAVTSAKIKKGAVKTAKIANGAVATGKIENGAVTAGKIAAGTLDSLTLARNATSACDPASSTYIDCGLVSLTLPRAARVLVVASAGFDGANSGSGYRGDCRISVDGATVGPTISNGSSSGFGVGFNPNQQASTALNVVTDALAAGAHSFALQCNQAGGSVEFPESYVSAVALGAG